MGQNEEEAISEREYEGLKLTLNMASGEKSDYNPGYSPPSRSQSLYLPRHNSVDEPEVLRRRVRSTRGKRSKKSTLFASRSIPKIPQVENSTDLFEKVISALRCCAINLKDTMQCSPITARRSLEQKIKWCEDRLGQFEDLADFYKHEHKMRQGARNLESALLSYGVKHGHEKCKSNYKEATINMCDIEDELEKRMGRFKIRIDGIDGFARLCTGDNFEIFVRNGSGRRWKAKCKIERDGQKWMDNEFEVKGSLKDGLFLRIIEVKKIASNSQIGSFSLRLRNYISANPMNLSIPVNKTGNLKLRVTIHWQPLSSKEEQKIKKTNRESLLSEVFFGNPVTITHDEPPRISMYSPPGFSPSSPSVSSAASTPSNPAFTFQTSMFENRQENHEKSSSSIEEISKIDFSEEECSEQTSDVSSPVNESFIHVPSPPPSTLSQLIRKLISILKQHKDQHPQLEQLYEKIEALDEILQGGKLARQSNLSGSVESALESFNFLEINDTGDREIQPSDTGYCSNDETTSKLIMEQSEEIKVSNEKEASLTNGISPLNNSDIVPDTDDDYASSSQWCFSGVDIIDKVLIQHLRFCLRLSEDLGSVGPLKSKESSAVIKLEWQSGILEKLIELAETGQPPQTISKAYGPLSASGHDEILLFWAGSCGENPLYIPVSDFVKALHNQFHQLVEEAYHRIADKLYSVITARILEENGSFITSNIDSDAVVSIYQFTDFFLIDQRWNLVKFVNNVAEELLTCGRFLNADRAVVLTQLQMYNKIPFKQSCCITAAKLLAHSDQDIVNSAGVYFHTVLKDGHKRAQAISYCIESLEDCEESQRIGACVALQKLQGKEALEQLIFLAKCDVDQVKTAADDAIRSLELLSCETSNGEIWKQAAKMSDLSKSTDF